MIYLFYSFCGLLKIFVFRLWLKFLDISGSLCLHKCNLTSNGATLQASFLINHADVFLVLSKKILLIQFANITIKEEGPLLASDARKERRHGYHVKWTRLMRQRISSCTLCSLSLILLYFLMYTYGLASCVKKNSCRRSYVSLIEEALSKLCWCSGKLCVQTNRR